MTPANSSVCVALVNASTTHVTVSLVLQALFVTPSLEHADHLLALVMSMSIIVLTNRFALMANVLHPVATPQKIAKRVRSVSKANAKTIPAKANSVKTTKFVVPSMDSVSPTVIAKRVKSVPTVFVPMILVPRNPVPPAKPVAMEIVKTNYLATKQTMPVTRSVNTSAFVRTT